MYFWMGQQLMSDQAKMYISKMPKWLGATWDSLDCLDIPWCSLCLKHLGKDWEKWSSIFKWSQVISSGLKQLQGT